MPKTILLIILIASLGVSGGILYFNSAGDIEITNAYVTGRIVKISTTRSGIVRNLKPKKGDHVGAGELLFRIESLDDESNINLMVENLRFAIAIEIDKCMELNVADTELAKQSLELAFAKRQKESFEALSKSNAISKEELKSKDLTERLLSTSLDLARRHVDIKRHANRGPIMERATTKLASEKLREAYRKRYLGDIYAPYSGYIYEVLTYAGQYVDVGHETLVLVPDAELVVEANVLETQLEFFRPGTSVKILPDSLHGKPPLSGSVQSIAPAVSAAFSSFPRNNSDSTWIKVTQRVPVLMVVTDATLANAVIPLGSSIKVIAPKKSAKIVESPTNGKTISTYLPTEESWKAEYQQRAQAIIRNEIRDMPQEFMNTCNR